MKKILFLITFILLLYPTVQRAQDGMLLHNMQNLPQTNSVNPSFFPENKWYMIMPILPIPSLGISYSTSIDPFSYVKRGADGTKQFQINKFLDGLDDINKTNLSFMFNPIGFGFRVNDNMFFTFSASARAEVDLAIDRGLFDLIARGNGDYIGKELSILPEGFLNINALAEISVGAGYKIDDQWTVGGHLKYLNGYLNVNSGDSYLALYTSDQIDYIETRQNIDLRGAGLMDFESQEITSYFTGNHGFGIDLGGTYKLNDKFQFTASILDLGYINWSENVTRIRDVNNYKSFRFEGFDIDALLNDGTESDIFKQLQDTLKTIYEFEYLKDEGASYTTMLPFKFYLSGSYNILPYLKANALYKGRIVNGTFYSSGNISANIRAGRWVEFSLGNSIIGTNWFNPSVGLALGNAFQVFIIVDYFSSFYLNRMNALSLQIGTNLKFGKLTPKTIRSK